MSVLQLAQALPLVMDVASHAVVTPGTHTVLVSGKRREPVAVAVVAEAGKNVFIKVDSWDWVWFPLPSTINLKEVSDQEDAMQEVRRCDLIKRAE